MRDARRRARHAYEDAAGRPRNAGGRQRRRQGLHLHRKRRELTGDSLQICLLRLQICPLRLGALRERGQHDRVLPLRRLNVGQRRIDGGVQYRNGNRLRRRFCNLIDRRCNTSGFRRGSEAPKSEVIEFREAEAIEARQGEAIQTRQQGGDGRADDEQGGQARHGHRYAPRCSQLHRVGQLVSVHFLFRYFSHLRSLRVSLVATSALAIG